RSGLPCVTTATRLTSAGCVFDPAFELIGILRPLAVDEVKEELAVPLRAGQAGVYDARDLGPPLRRRARDLREHAPPNRTLPDDALRRLGAARLELRLDEHERLPARRGQRERGRQGGTDADERDVAGDELRRERQFAQLTRVDPLEHGHARVGPQPRMELPMADVERDHPSRAA